MAEDVSPEITVNQEPWTGLVVVGHTTLPVDSPAYYGLVQASEWQWTGSEKDPDRLVTVWRGPQMPDEQVARKHLVEVDCRTVLVDERGFYTCPPIMDELAELIEKVAEPILDDMANERAAESNSYVHDGYEEDFGDDVWIKATYGDATAVNGELVYGKKDARPPRGWVLLEDRGGYDPSGQETEHEVDWLAESIERAIEGQTERKYDLKDIRALVIKKYGKYPVWSSNSGHTEVWVPKKALNEIERQKLERKKAAERAHEREVQERIKQRELEQQERKRKIKAGGFPAPKDWSPTGELFP